MKTILVSGASGIVGYGILRSLRKSGLPLKLIGTSIYDDSIAPAFCDTFELAPKTTDQTYMSWLYSVMQRHRVDMIIPGIEIDMYTWMQHADDIHQSGVTALLNTPSLINLCADKWTFYNHLVQVCPQWTIPTSLENQFSTLSEKFGLPFLVKPRKGFGSKGIRRIHDSEQFAACQDQIGPTLMAQPVIGNDDEEYTVSVYADGIGGFAAGIAMRRKLSENGFTEKAEVVSMMEFTDAISVMCQHLQPFGPTNFQFRKHDSGLSLLEINPRISSSTSVRMAFGYNESAMAVEHLLNNVTPTQPSIRNGKAIRYTEEHIIYEDRIHL